MEEHSAEGELLSELMQVSITEFLDQDSRPTFLVDLDPDTIPVDNSELLKPVFCNAALRSHAGLLDVITGEAEVQSLDGGDNQVRYVDFSAWATGISKHDDSVDIYPLFFLFCGMLWTGSTIRKRWRVISGNRCYNSSDISSGNLSSGPPSEIAMARSGRSSGSRPNKLPSKPTSQSTASITDRMQEVLGFSETITASEQSERKGSDVSPSTARDGSSASNNSRISDIINEEYLEHPGPVNRTGASDWTAEHLNGEISTHVAFVRQVNWSSTALGPMTTWSAEMRQMANFLMASPHPGALYWGDDLIMMYNEAYRDGIAGSKHPYLMGASFREGFSEISDTVSPIFAECRRTGRPVSMKNQLLPMERNGFLVERYFSWSFVPIYGGGLDILGFYNAPFETTKDIINDRRTRTLLQVGEKLAEARTVKKYWKKVMEGLEFNKFDITFALLYSVLDDNSTDDESSMSNSSDSSLALKSCVLEGCIGVPENHPAAPGKIDLKRSREGFIPSFREATRTRQPTMLRSEDGTLPEELIEGIQWRGFGEASRKAIILPIRPTTGENVMGFLIFGLNPRRPWDSDYQFFLALLNRQLATSLASVVLYEDELKRGEISALEQVKLEAQLEQQRTRMQTMAQVAPVGMFYIDSNGSMLEANNKWHEITGDSKDQTPVSFGWMQSLTEESREIMEEGWRSLTIDRKPWSSELKLKKTLFDPITKEERQRWILASSQPDLAPDGSLRSVLGAITDITEQKTSAEHAEARAQLSERLLSALRETKESELRFHQFATLIPIGVSIFTHDGEIVYCNPAWWTMTGFDPKNTAKLAWLDCFLAEDMDAARDVFRKLTQARTAITFETRMNKPWVSPDESMSLPYSWFLCSTTPQFKEDGSIKAILGCMTDISQRKHMEEEQRRRKEEALERATLSEQLAKRTQEAAESQKIFRRFSDLAPDGLFIMDGEGRITYANDQWFEISGHPRDVSAFATPVSWMRIIDESCMDEFKSKWEALMGSDHIPVNMEIKSSSPWESYVGGTVVENNERWILAQAVPEIGEDGSLIRIMGCITDISRIKWAETLQNRRLEEAEETRRQQNNFIDITSHEMRNPLSAMIQSADFVSSSLNDYRSAAVTSAAMTNELVESCIDAAETIMLCAQHQKSIIDDILTLSKLDSNLLLIVPDAVQPVEVIRRALRMVDSELKKYDMEMEFNVDPSLATLQVGWVLMDAARVLQILINLLTNAIKFTQGQIERRIIVSITASLTPPSLENERDIEYFPAKVPKTDTTFGNAWGTGEIIYLRIKVQDTGVGLNPNERKLLFLRFSQASPKTHTQYGGSGLGLFISRQLTELLGGEIGVASKSGVGSTFAFFVKVRRIGANGTGINGPLPASVSINPGSADGGAKLFIPEVVVMPSNIVKDGAKTTAFSISASSSPSSSATTTRPNQLTYHVLVVEDNLVNQKVLSKQLIKAGCIVTVANHGVECLDFLRESKFYDGMETSGKELHVVLLDLEMPVMDGLTCIRTIREWEKATMESVSTVGGGEGVGKEGDELLKGRLVRHVPVIAITANARHEQVQMAIEAGMDDVLPKPFRIVQLMPKIETLLARYNG